MGSREDDERAYRTSEDMVGRSIRRGTRKAIKALTFGALGGDVASGAATHLASDGLERRRKPIGDPGRREDSSLRTRNKFP